MASWVPVADATDMPPGAGRVVEAAGRRLALFNVDGTFYALDNVCLHRGGPIGEGDLDGTIVTCPWHGFQYDVTTGRHVLDPEVGLQTFPARVRDGRVEVLIEGAS
jgi:nitrite reductase (NADH) small subunit